MTTGYGPSDATWAALDFERNGDNVALLAHELGHSIGDLRHVVGCGGAGPDLRYPDGSGLLASWAFIPPARAGEPGRTIGPTDAHDVMTYCDQRDARRRMSRYSWDAFVRHVVVAGPGLAPAPRTAARRTLRVLVLAAQGGRAVATVVPSTDAPTGVPTGATATLVARDAAGAVVLSRPLALVADGAADGAAAVRASPRP